MLIEWASSTYLVAPNWKRFWIPGSRLQEEETLYLVSFIVSTSIHPGPLHNQKYTCWETSSIRQIIMHWSHVHRAQSSTKVRFACLSLHLINLWKFKKKKRYRLFKLFNFLYENDDSWSSTFYRTLASLWWFENVVRFEAPFCTRERKEQWSVLWTLCYICIINIWSGSLEVNLNDPFGSYLIEIFQCGPFTRKRS